MNIVIKQNESEVGCEMLLVSEIIFRFNTQMSMLKSDTCRMHMFHVTQVKQMLCKPEYCKVHNGAQWCSFKFY